MPSIAKLKKEILLKKGLKNDPVKAVGELLNVNPEIIKLLKELYSQISNLSAEVSEIKKENILLKGSDNSNLIKNFVGKIEAIEGNNGTNGDKGDVGERGEKGDAGPQGISGLDGKDGKDGITPIAGIDFPIPENGKDGIEIEPIEIVKKINSLPLDKDRMIDAKHIKGLPDTKLKGTDLFRGGLKLRWNTQLDGTVNGTNKVFTVPTSQGAPKDDKFIISARGVLKTSDAGDFTATNGNRTITFASAPPDGSDAPRIILYHEK